MTTDTNVNGWLQTVVISVEGELLCLPKHHPPHKMLTPEL